MLCNNSDVIFPTVSGRQSLFFVRDASSTAIYFPVLVSSSCYFAIIDWPLGSNYAMIGIAGPSSVVCLVVISWKLSKIDPQLLWNSIRKLASLILLPQSGLPQMLSLGHIQVYKYRICVNINTASCSTWRQTTVVVNRARPSSRRWCCQLLLTECDARNLLFTFVVLCVNLLWAH